MKSVIVLKIHRLNYFIKWVSLLLSWLKSLYSKQGSYTHLVGYKGIVMFHSANGIGVNVTNKVDGINCMYKYHTSIVGILLKFN